MSKTLTFEIADKVHCALQEMAEKSGRPFEELALQWLMKYRPRPRPAPKEQDRREAWQRLQRHLGAQNLGHPTGSDNATIDADLVREYGSNHEEP